LVGAAKNRGGTLIVRSLDKGGTPTHADGTAIVFADYKDATPYLKQRLGRYCSYCERTIPASLAVEHKLPKTGAYQHLEHEWRNLLLACSNCNSSKGTNVPNHANPLWPDEDDTFAMIEYHRSGGVAPKSGLPPDASARVTALLDLVGLTKTPDQSGQTDHRFFDRLEVWRKAEQAVVDVETSDSPALRRSTVEVARSSGGYSIWRHAFAADTNMTQRLMASLPGTRAASQ
jgi:uncharacterized protein (TIGR02646 family)